MIFSSRFKEHCGRYVYLKRVSSAYEKLVAEPEPRVQTSRLQRNVEVPRRQFLYMS